MILPSDGAAAVTPMTGLDDFDAFYRDHYRTMVRLAYLLVDTQQEAEDVVQDAFAVVLPRLARLDNPAAYLRLCVLNRCRHLLRRRRVVRRQPAPVHDESSLGFNHLLDAVRRLPHRQRSAVVLRYELQLTDAEIAEVLRVPVGTAKSTLHRAIARLRLEVER